jgi:GNAT superfamily N-acetyltransferase
MTIRRATSADPPGIAAAQVAAWRSAYRDILPASYLASLSALQKEPIWIAAAAGTSTALFVVEDESGIAGFACAGAARDADVDREHVGEISAIYLLEHLWGRGVGATLFYHACAALADMGFAELIVWVLEANSRARSFYERKGMSLDPAEHAFILDGGLRFPELRYRKAL